MNGLRIAINENHADSYFADLVKGSDNLKIVKCLDDYESILVFGCFSSRNAQYLVFDSRTAKIFVGYFQSHS